MSEDFDKEAEREKLREKYERDKEKRQETEQMSELLLQGATMTNAHCSECGDPIFRYEGQEFCPTCEKPVDRAEGAEDGEESDEDDDSIQVTTPSDDARVAFGEDGQAEATGDPSPEQVQQAPQQSTDQQTPDRQSANTQEQAPDRQSAGSREQAPSRQSGDIHEHGRGQPARQPEPSARTAATPPADPQSPTGEASVTAARESLVQTLTRFSQQAAATEDPARAQEHLAAAREAAEALAALKR